MKDSIDINLCLEGMLGVHRINGLRIAGADLIYALFLGIKVFICYSVVTRKEVTECRRHFSSEFIC